MVSLEQRSVLPFPQALDTATFTIKGMGTGGPARLRGHIVNDHFASYNLSWLGVARFDIELAHAMNIPLDWVVKRAYRKLEEGWAQHVFEQPPEQAFDEVYIRLGLPWNQDWCRFMVVKNLLCIAQLGLGQIDWDVLERLVPDARGIELDLERDSYDPFIYR